MIDELKKLYKQSLENYKIKPRIVQGLIEEYLLSEMNDIIDTLIKSANRGESYCFYPMGEIVDICKEHYISREYQVKYIRESPILQTLGLNISLFNCYIKFSGWAEEEINIVSK